MDSIDLNGNDGAKEQIAVRLKKGNKGYGFTLAGQYPCVLSNVQANGVAYKGGLRSGDRLLFITDCPVAHMDHPDIAQLLARAGPILHITVARPVVKVTPNCDADCVHDGDTSADSDSQVWQEQRRGAEHRLLAGVQAGGSLKKHNKMSLGSALSTGTSNLHKRRSGSIEGLLTSTGSSRRKSTGSRIVNGFLSARQHLYNEQTVSPDRPGPFTCAGVLAAANNKEDDVQDVKSNKKLNSLFFRHDSFDDSTGKISGKKSKKDKKSSLTPNYPSRLHRSCSQPEGLHEDMDMQEHNDIYSDSENEHQDIALDDSIDSLKNASHDTSLKRERRRKNKLLRDLMGEEMIFECVLVYIGAVPVPHLNLSHRHIVRSALLSLQTQKAKARTVLFQVFSHQIVVTNSRCAVTHRMRTSCIVFTTPCAESTQYFGICTVHSPLQSSSPDGPPSSVCHMFAADPELHLHSFHYHYARKFGVQCSRDPESGFCLEFPYVSGPVLHAISYARKSYHLMKDAEIKAEGVLCPSTVTSSTSNRRRGYASSNNSDSGIGEALPESHLTGGSQGQRSKSYSKENKLRVTFEEPVVDSDQPKFDVVTPSSTPTPSDMTSSPESIPPPLPPKIYLSGSNRISPELEKTDGSQKSGSLLKDVMAEIDNQEHQRKLGSEENCSMRSEDKMCQIVEASPTRLHRSWSTDLLHARCESGSGEVGELMDFDNMLHDPHARTAFQTFLQHQFCGENLTFWIGVEQFRKAQDSKREKMGRELFEKHFSCGCGEPVNVDSAVMQKIKEAVAQKNFHKELYDMAQHQIFHLMKYDCWPRFLKSDLASGAEKFSGSKQGTGANAMDKSRDQKRRSLLPGGMKQKLAVFSRGVGGEKKKKEEKTPNLSAQGSKKQASWRKGKQTSMPSQLAHSTAQASTSNPTQPQSARPDVVPEYEPLGPSPTPGPLHPSGSTCSAPTSTRGHRCGSNSDIVDESSPRSMCNFEMDMTSSCVVVLPSGETVALPVQEDINVRHWLHSVALENGVNPAAAELYDIVTGDQIDASCSALLLRGKQTRLEAAVLFKVDLPMSTKDSIETNEKPMRKLVAVRARPESAAGLVLRPVLSRYGLDLDKLVVCMCDSTEVLPNSAPIRRADGRKLIVLTNREFQEWVHSDHGESSCPSTPRGDDPSKSVDLPSTSYNQSDSSNPGTSALSGMLKFVRSSKNGGGQRSKNGGSPPSRLTTTSASFHGQLLQRKSLGGNGSFTSARSISTPSSDKRLTLGNAQEFRDIMMKEQALADLVEKAQCSRLDDQRVGSFKAQFELPDFLKRNSRSASIPTAEEVFVPATDFFRNRPEHRCVVAVDPPPRCPPSPREIQVVYDSNMSGNDSSSNVSIVTVGEVPSMEGTEGLKKPSPPTKHRPPPPPYPGAKVSSAESNKAMAPRPKPIYVPTNVGEANEMGGWKVDYV